MDISLHFLQKVFMGICFSKADQEPLSFVGHNHPVGVAGLPKRELDHSPDHVLPQGDKCIVNV